VSGEREGDRRERDRWKRDTRSERKGEIEGKGDREGRERMT